MKKYDRTYEQLLAFGPAAQLGQSAAVVHGFPNASATLDSVTRDMRTSLKVAKRMLDLGFQMCMLEGIGNEYE
ncbi:hypothetical protein HYALB_00004546 [Hymenoscyphus albidus]|uniref:Uncharacterized protein n=1 Tax=Hymenoscyphus albidus TaxID=595503 RepID=A0A9N9M0A0_9HELO|nr:hypothetical protein HYALB_00004546 [Hymenoscyphus albidus]